MGIKGLMKLIGDTCPSVVEENSLDSYFGRKVALDASMCMYQFLIALRGGGMDLTNEAGEITSHISGIFYRTIRMIENGLKPLYVFDGAPPQLKSIELSKRTEKQSSAKEKEAEAIEAGDAEEVNKYSKRTIRVSKEQNEQVKKLLRLMGIPVIEAPGEAEAQCAKLVKDEVVRLKILQQKQHQVWAMGSEDMDSLTFGANILLRNLTASEAQKKKITEVHIDKVLEGLGLNMDQAVKSARKFIDLCILCGCDYCGTLRGVGPKSALTLIKKHGNIEKVLEQLDEKKYPRPDPFPYEEVRMLFKEPDVKKSDEFDIKWKEPDEEGLVAFLVDEYKFNKDRVVGAIERMKKAAKQKGSQSRLESFFSVQRVPNEKKRKRDADAKKKGPANKKQKTGRGK